MLDCCSCKIELSCVKSITVFYEFPESDASLLEEEAFAFFVVP